MNNNEDNIDFRNEFLMANPQYFNINRLKEDDTEKKFIENNKKFYKKRIFTLTKDIFKQNIDDPKAKNTIEYFNKFLFSAINYLQLIDEKDIIQEQLNNNINNKSNNILNNLPSIEEDYINKVDLERINNNVNKTKTIEEYYNIKSKKKKIKKKTMIYQKF